MTVEGNKITADEGKVFADKEGSVIVKTLYLGIVDSADNYVEVEAEPTPEQEGIENENL